MPEPVRVHVILSGIVSLIPTDEGWLVRLQDAREVKEPLEPHQATIVAEATLATALNADGTKREPDIPKTKGLVGWKIGYGKIELLSMPIGPKIDPKNTPKHLLHLGDAFDDSTKAVAHSFKAAELLITAGGLAATGMEPKSWRFAKAGENHAHWIAEEACWGFGTLDAQRQLSLSFQDPDNDTKRCTLSVQAPDDGPIELRLQNVPYSDAIPKPMHHPHAGHGGHAGQAAHVAEEEDYHTALYFLQCKYDPEKGKTLISGGKPGNKPNVDTHHHRLAGRTIMMEGLPAELKTKDAHPESIRINCPPAVWSGLDTTSITRTRG